MIFILFFLSYFFFFLSLERCLEGEDNCCMKFTWMIIKVIEESISCILTIIYFEYRKYSKNLNFEGVFLSTLELSDICSIRECVSRNKIRKKKNHIFNS